MNQFRGRAFGASLAALSCALLASSAFAHAPLPGAGLKHHAGAWERPFHASNRTQSGTWSEVTPFIGANGSPETSLLMLNGTVITHDVCGQWYRLTPDANGQYATGTWSAIGKLPNGYTPLYFASAVLGNGDVIMNGGEYNTSGCQDDHTTLGAYYNAAKNKWSAVQAPSGWTTIGDAVSIVLQSGTYMLSNCCDEQIALATISKKDKVTWTATGTNKKDDNNEEGWTLLPNGNVLNVDIWSDPGKDSPAELYSPSSGMWTATGTTTNVMADPRSFELGPALLLPNGTVFQIGTDPCAKTGCASHTSIYNIADGTWTAGPDELELSGDYYTTEDAPGVVLPDGNVLSQQSPGYACGSAFCSPSHFFEYDGSAWTQVDDPVSGQAAGDASYEGRFLPLPTGQILWTSDQGDIEVYTPTGSPNKKWMPTIKSVSNTLSAGETGVVLKGKQLMGVADGGKYGDDAQMDSKYPIIRIANNSGGVCYATTTKFSPTSATFTVPATGCNSGASELEVVVNGIASKPTAVTVD